MLSLEEELTCAVCRELLYEPTLLACGHAYCRPCLKEALSAASAVAGDAGLVRRCLVCRGALCGCTLQLPVNVVLWNTVKLLFPTEVGRRRRAHLASVATARMASKGEDGGRHSDGYALVRPLGDEWHNLGRKGFYAQAARSVVLDADDQRRQVALCFGLSLKSAPEDGSEDEGGSARPPRVVSLGDTLTVAVYALSLEEDEASEAPPGGFPHLYNKNARTFETAHGDDDDDDAAIVWRSHGDGRFHVTVAGPGVAWSGSVASASGASVGFTVPWGDAPGEYHISAVDDLTGAACSLKLPVAPVGTRRRRAASKRASATEGSGDSGSSSSDEEELDEFEDDGFVVRSDDEKEGEGDDFGGSGSEASGQEGCAEAGSDREDESDAGAACAVCWESTDDASVVLLCEGCDDEVHLLCAGLQAVPEGDWFCAACKPSASAKASARVLAAAAEQDDGDDASPVAAQRKGPGKKRRRKSAALLDSDSE
jgi:hypothetical protein